MTTPAVEWWASPTTRLWQIICGDRSALMQRAVVQEYIGATVNIPAGVYGMLEALKDLDFLVFTPRGGSGINLPLVQCWGTRSLRSRPVGSRKMARTSKWRSLAWRPLAEPSARRIPSSMTTLWSRLGADRPANRARLAAPVIEDLETFTLDVCGVSDVYATLGPTPRRWSPSPPFRGHIGAVFPATSPSADILTPKSSNRASPSPWRPGRG